MKKFNQFREDSLLEVLKASDPTGKWIDDFVHSDNPKFAGKSKKERIRMALGASYASKRNEEFDLEEAIKLGSKVKMHSPGKDYHEQEGHVGEIRHGLYKGAPKKYTIDYGNGKSVQLGKSNIKHQTPDKWHAEENNHWHDAGKQDAENGKRPKPRTYLPTLKDKQAKHPEEVYFYMNGYKSIKQGVAEGHYEDADDHMSKANDADAKGDKLTYHHHMADYHDSLSQWHEDKGRSASADKHAEKADFHSDKYTELARGVKEAKDEGEYDYEGAMAKTQLQTICRAAAELKDILKDDENLPEWVQSKITKAEDYITSSLDYMKSSEELGEEVEELDELSKSTLGSYAKKAARDSTITRKIASDFEHMSDRARTPGMKQAAGMNAQNYKERSWKRRDNVDKAIDRLTKEDTEVAEARMSAAQRLWNAEQKQRAKSDASLARTPSSIPKPEEKK